MPLFIAASAHADRRINQWEFAATVAQHSYSRESYGYRSYRFPKGTAGFYSASNDCKLNVDHVVALKDADDSGGNAWSPATKTKFGNDKENHVPSCARVNSMKAHLGPSGFLRRSSDGKGVEVQFPAGRFCEYVGIYYKVKIKYRLSFANNDPEVFVRCGYRLPATGKSAR